MEFRNDRRELFSSEIQACVVAFSIRIGMIRITFEQHAGA
jgi:hypothetical protein